MFDLIIKNGNVVDGSNQEPRIADIGITGDVIEAIGNLAGQETKATIDASGKMVTPGFIDIHSHSDEAYLINPLAESKLRQGITTEVIGQCGSSPFPLSEEVRERYQGDVQSWGIKIDWTKPEEFFNKVEQAKPAVNIVPFVGQGTLRATVMGYEDRKPTPDEMKRIKGLLAEALDAGCWGMSTGLIYPPGCFTPTDELVELAKVLKEREAVYASHIRSEGDELLGAIQEAISIGKAAGVRVEISHLKASGSRNWGKAEKAIEFIVKARDEDGLSIGFDRYPYTASSTSLSSLLPSWAHAGGHKQTIENIRNPDTSDRMIDEMQENLEGAHGWGSIIIANAGCPEYEQFEGFSIKEIAKAKGLSPEVVVFHILLKSAFSAGICAFTMNQEETEMILTHPLCAVCTDATARAVTGPLSKSKPHPRTFGSFPKFFRNYVKEKASLNIQEAVAKTSGNPAERLGIKKRGFIREGYFADILVIDWDSFTDTATYENPISLSKGIKAIIVNGKTVFFDEVYTNERPGRILRHA